MIEIGYGSGGTVYKDAKNPCGAIKKCVNRDKNDGITENTLLECQLLTILKNSNYILRLEKIDMQIEEVLIYFELCDMNLYDYMFSHIDKYNIINVGKKLCEHISIGLYTIHKKGFVHLDIKPNNILVKLNNGNITFVIADFGSCLPYFEGKKYLNIFGIHGYIAPECLENRNKIIFIDPKIDVFSAGCCFYDYFYRNNKLGGTNVHTTINKFYSTNINKTTYPDNIDTKILLNREDIPNTIYNFIDNCLKINSLERYSPHNMCNYLGVLPIINESKIVNLNRGTYKCGIDTKLRMINITREWIIEISKRFKFNTLTTLLCLDITDRITHNYEIKKSQLQLFICACLHIASKFTEIYHGSVDDYTWVSDNCFTVLQLNKMEIYIVESLNYVIICDEFKIFAKAIEHKINNEKLLKLYKYFLNNKIDPGKIAYSEKIWYEFYDFQ